MILRRGGFGLFELPSKLEPLLAQLRDLLSPILSPTILPNVNHVGWIACRRVVSEPARYEKKKRVIEAGVQHRKTAPQPGLSSAGGVCGRLFKPSRSELWAHLRDRGGYLQFTEGNQGQPAVSAGGGQVLFDFDLRKYSPRQGRYARLARSSKIPHWLRGHLPSPQIEEEPC